ncbi:DUF3558 domain-containing protein [Actinokineospora sp. NPDC004072]
MRKAVALVAVVVLASACSTPEQGQPRPGDPGGTTQPPSPSTPDEPAGDLPDRPEEIRLEGVKPCDLLTAAQQADLEITRFRERDYEGQAECAFTVNADSEIFDITVLLDTREGAEAWLTENRNVVAKPTEVGGFGAVNFWFSGGEGYEHGADCNTAVDVADGQHVQVGLLSPGSEWTQEQFCEITERFAEATMTTLRAR